VGRGLDRGQIDEEQFTARNAALLQEKAQLQARWAELDAKLAEGESVEISLDKVRQTLQDFHRVWAHLTLEEGRELLRSLVEDLRVWRDRAELKLLFFPPTELSVVFQRGPTPERGSPSSPRTEGES